MSALSDELAAIKASVESTSTAIDGIVTGIAALDAKITALQSGATLNATDQAALDAIKTESSALLAKAQGVSTTPPA